MVSNSSNPRLNKIKKIALAEDNFTLDEIIYLDKFPNLVTPFDDEESILNKFKSVRRLIGKKELI